jgi:hypothetical protein
MNVPDWLQSLCSTAWAGESKLWLDSTQPPVTSEVTARIALVANGNAASITYTWYFEDVTQAGILLVGVHEDGSVEASLLDSFHTSDGFMVSKGNVLEGQKLDVLASYAAPPGPDWGWRTEIEKLSDAAWRVRMFNITPSGDEAFGFEMNFHAA